MPPTTPTAPSPPTPTAAVRKVYPASAESAQADVLRLAALVDDLQRKNAAFQTKATAAERSAANATQRAAVERNALTSKLHGVQRELAISKDAEEKAKIELRAVSNAEARGRRGKDVDAREAAVGARADEGVAAADAVEHAPRARRAQGADEAARPAGRPRAGDGAVEEAGGGGARGVGGGARRGDSHVGGAGARPPGKAARRGRGGGGRVEELESQGSPGPGDGHDGVARGSGANAAEGAAAAPDVPDIPEAPPALAPAWSAEERRRAAAACSCCAYGVPADLFGPLLEQVQETAGAPSGPKPREAPAPDQSPEQALACAVEKDLLENFKHNILTHSGIPARQDVAPMFPHTEEHQGNGGYEGVLEKERPSHCADDEQK